MNAQLLQLYSMAQEAHIAFYFRPLHNKRAFVIKHDGYCVVANLGMSEREEKCIVAEEIGHCVTDSFYSFSLVSRLRSRNIVKAERKAKDYAVRFLVQLEPLKTALEHTQDIYELAELLDVDEQTVKNAVEYYKRKGQLGEV